MVSENLIPKIGVITDIRRDTPDVKTFRVLTTDGKKPFEHLPGQCAMLSVPGVGEAMFSITSSPTNEEFMEFSIKKCGCLTEVLHSLEVGQQVTIRGPYGKNFPVEGEFRGKDLLFIAGGIGLAPLRSVINYVRHYRKNYGKVVVVYGARSKDDLVDIEEIQSEWEKEPDFKVYLTASPARRAERIFKREGGSLEERLEQTERRDANDSARYRRIYGIDNCDTSPADLVIDTDDRTPDQIVEMIVQEVDRRRVQ